MSLLSKLKIDGMSFKSYAETGLARGEGIGIALKHGFKETTSFEFHADYIESAKNKYKNNTYSDKINFVLGDSGESLKKNISNLAEPFLLFLDAHAHEAGTCPLPEEIIALKNNFSNMLLLVDDVYFIESAKKYPLRAPWANEINGLNSLKKMIATTFKAKPTFIKLIYPFTSIYREGGKNYILLALHPKLDYSNNIINALKFVSFCFQILNPIVELGRNIARSIYRKIK